MPARTVSALPPRSTKHQTLQPPGWPAPKGYANGIKARGEFVFVGGMVGWDENEKFPKGFVAQAKQALENIRAVLAEGKAGPEHIVRLTWYLTSRSEYEAAGPGIGAAWKETLGRNFPPSTLLYIEGLVDYRAKVEIEVTAFVPKA